MEDIEYKARVFFLQNGYLSEDFDSIPKEDRNNLKISTKRSYGLFKPKPSDDPLKETTATLGMYKIEWSHFSDEEEKTLYEVPLRGQLDLILKLAHDENEHYGIEQTISRIFALGWNWQTMKKDVTNYMKSCRNCLKENHLSPTQTLRIMQRGMCDFMEMEPDPKTKDRYILILIDALTKFMWTWSTPTRDPAFVARCFKETFENKRSFEEWQCGNSKELKDSAVTSVIKNDLRGQIINNSKADLKCHTLMTPAKTNLARCLRFTTIDPNKPKSWSKLLNSSVYICNKTYHSTLKMSPYKALYGVHPPEQNRGESHPKIPELPFSMTRIDRKRQECLNENMYNRKFTHKMLRKKTTKRKIDSSEDEEEEEDESEEEDIKAQRKTSPTSNDTTSKEESPIVLESTQQEIEGTKSHKKQKIDAVSQKKRASRVTLKNVTNQIQESSNVPTKPMTHWREWEAIKNYPNSLPPKRRTSVPQRYS